MGQSDAAIRRCWQEWVYNGRFQHHDGSAQHRATANWEGRLIVISVITARHATRTQVSTMTIHRQLIERNLRS
ncbi:HTH_Tnp_Tc3_2 domain-containing protein [Trichonephila clavipes]|nr:HTH_Tnp_Tc3_2 domain-containing protein [Trichonephila clavipes]